MISLPKCARWLLLGMLVGTCAPALGQELEDPDAAVEAGRESLGSFWDLPWYDAEADDYRPVDLPPPPKPPSGFWKWLGDLFSGWNLNFGEVLTFLGWVLVLALITGVIIAVIRAYSQADMSVAVETAQRHDAQAHIERVEALPVTLENPIDDFLQAARDAFESGDLSTAIVYLFSYELIELDRRSLLRLVKGKTNRQYLRELRGKSPDSPRLAEILLRTITLFEASFFGAHPPSREALHACWTDAEEFQRLLNQTREEAA